MSKLVKALEAGLADLPYKFLEALLIKKLKEAGTASPEIVAPKLVAHMRSGNEGKFLWDDEAGGETRDVELSISASELDEIEKKTSDFLTTKLPEIIEKTATDSAKQLLISLKKRWPEQDEWLAAQTGAFRHNIQLRWGKPLGLLRMMLTISRDLGEAGHKRFRRSKRMKQPLTWELIYRLHARACQVTDEILTLFEGGFADGAMARWRTLHEISVVATLIAEFGEDLAQRYVAHEVVEAKAALDEYERTLVPLGYPLHSARDKKKILNGYDKAIAVYGKPFASPYGWAADQLKSKKPIFPDLELAAGRAQMRSYYKVASYGVHASPKGIFTQLGIHDFRSLILAGASNAGLSEPGQNAGVTLLHITSLLLGPSPDFEDMIQLTALLNLQNEIKSAFVKAEGRLRREDKKYRHEDSPRKTKRASKKAV